MKVQIACLLAGMALLAGAKPATAADWGSGAGGIKDYGGAGGVPVPAPVPIPEFKPSWYFRFDAGLGVIGEPDFSEEGFIYGANDGPGSGPGDVRSIPAALFSSDFNTLLTLGGGVGYYLGNGLRIDATVENRSKDDAVIEGHDEYVTHGYDAGLNWVPVDANANGIADAHSRLTISDQSKVNGTVWLANAYYDIGTVRGFTPYVGGGVGFVWNEISRHHTSSFETCDAEPAVPNGGCGYVYNTIATTTVSNKSDTVSLAAAAMAGFSYELSDITSVDVGYRYLYLAGTGASMDINGADSTIKIGDQSVHQVRAGLRFNVD